MSNIQTATQQKGFSLIELMIVLGVIGLLASIAWPAYQEYIHKSRRAEGQVALLELSQYLERFYTANGRYDQDRNGNDVALPYTEAPRDGGAAKYYDLAFADGFPTSSAYTLKATPKGVMATDLCGTLSLTHRGEKSQTGGSLSQCWRR